MGSRTKYVRAIAFTTVFAIVAVVVVARTTMTVHMTRLNDALAAAVRQDDTADVLKLLAEGADPNARRIPSKSVSVFERFKRALHVSYRDSANRQTAKPQTVGEFYREADLQLPALGQALRFWWFEARKRKENVPMVRALILYGADVNASDVDGDTPLSNATTLHYTNTMRLLIRHGANVNCQERGKRTPLILATARNDLASMRLLLESGADPNIPNSNGATCLKIAELGGELRAAQMLRAAGARR